MRAVIARRPKGRRSNPGAAPTALHAVEGVHAEAQRRFTRRHGDTEKKAREAVKTRRWNQNGAPRGAVFAFAIDASVSFFS